MKTSNRKWLSAMVCMLLIGAAAYGNADAAVSNVRGDVNGDGKVTHEDLELLRKHLDSTDINKAGADMDGDGKITITDSNMLTTLLYQMKQEEQATIVLETALARPLKNQFTTYTNLSGTEGAKVISTSSIHSDFNAYFLDSEIYSNGMMKVTYIDANYKYPVEYIKVSDVIQGVNVLTPAMLRPVTATKEYTLYVSPEYKKGDTYASRSKIEKGEQYYPLYKNGDQQQVYVKGPGQMSYIGWIREEMQQVAGIKGDLNNDGKVDQTDLTLMKNYLVGLSTAINTLNADMDGDQKITSTDLGLLKAKVEPQAQYQVVNVSNGLYALQPKSAPAKEMTSNGKDKSLTVENAHSASDTSTSSQKWTVTAVGNNFYKLTPEGNSGIAINNHNRNAVEGNPITLWDYGGETQQFRFLSCGDGYYLLQANVGGSYVLEAASDNTVKLSNWANRDSQKWKLVSRTAAVQKPSITKYAVTSVPNGMYQLQPVCGSGKVLTVKGAGKSYQTPIMIDNNSNATHQKWGITRRSNGYYTLIDQNSGLAIDNCGGGASNGNTVWLYVNEEQTTTGEFQFRKTNDGYYVIQAHTKSGEYVLNITNGSSNAGALLQLWEFNDSNAQKWKLVQTSAAYQEWTATPKRTCDVFIDPGLTTRNGGEYVDTSDPVTVFGEEGNAYHIRYKTNSGAPKERWVTKEIFTEIPHDQNLSILISTWKGRIWDNRESATIGSQCFGFANYIFRELHETICGPKNNFYYVGGLKSGVRQVKQITNTNTSNLDEFFKMLKAGDFIQGCKFGNAKQHSMIFVSYDAGRKVVTLFDANFVDPDTERTNLIKRREQTVAKFDERFDMVTAYTK